MILPEYVADTNALLWYLLRSPNLGANALAAFRSAAQGQAQIILPSMVIAEFYYAIIKHKMPLNFAQELARLQSAAQFVFVDFKAADTLLFDQLAIIPEMHDRIIAGVALTRNCPCLTRDASITNSGLVQVVW